MRRHANASIFLMDQATSSGLTFMLLTTVARQGGPSQIGTVALIQSCAMIALTCGRAIGLDVWASRGSSTDERRSALASSIVPAALPLIAGVVIVVFAGQLSFPIMLYASIGPFICILDYIRVLLMHRGASWVTLSGQSITLLLVTVSGYWSSNLLVTIGIYCVGIVLTVSVGYLYLSIGLITPTAKYSIAHRERSLPFLGEVLLGSVLQQVLFLLVAAVSGVDNAGTIRTAQTLLGPIIIVYSGLSPILLKRFGTEAAIDGNRTARLGAISGIMIAVFGLASVFAGAAALRISVGGRSLAEVLVGNEFEDLLPVFVLCGVGTAFNGILLGVGIALRVLDLTGRLNRIRILVIPLQVIVVVISGFLDNIYLIAASLSSAALISSVLSLWVLHSARSKYARSGVQV